MAITPRNDRADSDDGGTAAAAQQRSSSLPEQRSSSLPIKIAGGYDFVGAQEAAAAQSLKARASDADWRALLFWERMGKPAQLDPRKSPTRSQWCFPSNSRQHQSVLRNFVPETTHANADDKQTQCHACFAALLFRCRAGTLARHRHSAPCYSLRWQWRQPTQRATLACAVSLKGW